MKKGFTLAELLGVIVILGLLALIITPAVTTTINDSKEKSYNKQVDIIETSAREYGLEKTDFLPESGSKKISLDTLINSGKIQNSSINDPRNNTEMNGCVVVSYNLEYNQYEYKYTEDTALCDSLTALGN